jgi:hypothetical protein
MTEPIDNHPITQTGLEDGACYWDVTRLESGNVLVKLIREATEVHTVVKDGVDYNWRWLTTAMNKAIEAVDCVVLEAEDDE